MDRTAMREHVAENLGFPSSQLDPVKVDRHLDRIYQFEIPNRCQGTAANRKIEFNLTASQGDYPLSDLETANGGITIFSLASRTVIVDDLLMDYFTDPGAFWEDYYLSDLSEGQPYRVLNYGRILTFRRVPDQAFAAAIFVNASRASFGTEIADDLEAWVCIWGASYYLGGTYGQGESSASHLDRYNATMAMLNAKYVGDPQPQPIAKEF